MPTPVESLLWNNKTLVKNTSSSHYLVTRLLRLLSKYLVQQQWNDAEHCIALLERAKINGKHIDPSDRIHIIRAKGFLNYSL